MFGQFVAAGVLRGQLDKTGEWAFRLPYALQWIFPPLILIGAILAPESPWWLVRHGKMDQARKALLSLTKADSGIPFDVDKQIAMIKATNDLEIAMSEGTNYWDLFRGVNLRRTEITCMVWLTQAFCGECLSTMFGLTVD